MTQYKEKTREQKIHDLKVEIAAYETIVTPYAIALMKAKRKLQSLEPCKIGDNVMITSFNHNWMTQGSIIAINTEINIGNGHVTLYNVMNENRWVVPCDASEIKKL